MLMDAIRRKMKMTASMKAVADDDTPEVESQQQVAMEAPPWRHPIFNNKLQGYVMVVRAVYSLRLYLRLGLWLVHRRSRAKAVSASCAWYK